MDITFYGAAGEVTGSSAVVRHSRGAFMVDCGMFQGGRDADRKNFSALDFDFGTIDFVLLTHAHLDHTGLIPRLVALGYRGPVYATDATADLLTVMLLDSAHIQEKEAEWSNKRNRSRRMRRRDTAPLYTVEQARTSLRALERVHYDENLTPHAAVSCRFRDAGHILGSAIIELDLSDEGVTRRLVFSGDLGQPDRPVLRDPFMPRRADYLCVESTYGNRFHRDLHETESELVHALNDTLGRKGGNVIIPAFAVGRTQEVLFILAKLVRMGQVPRLEVVVDSPMATAVTELTMRHAALWDEETRELAEWMRTAPSQFRLRFVADVEESIALNHSRGGLVIISASGMCDAGRIKYHLRYNLGREECSVIIAGFQAAGTLGRRLVDRARVVTIMGERIAVHAEIYTIGGLSAHADQGALLAWMRHFETPPRQTFIVHGEAEARTAFAQVIEADLGWSGLMQPVAGTTYHLN
ncbi:MBL fold metallo-hydrolase [Azoarcus sp. L1K30]|uniref:MBL fold metallo-hydrolase RNA specificity domain-containing protein n=1 Tax=Azoarcus sp. L1K30 TaxID=2820277 RepID=UPI001B815EE4|nr:MBL fold metallo-hydrolase [Azoarcus sp. L1K30]MBR0564667.1 MBL fold metallo-hydrolase [Azoarcus sp. L1K30]